MTDQPHDYLSTACLHGRHDYCNSTVGVAGDKKAATCKWCDARCRCDCGHERDGVDDADR